MRFVAGLLPLSLLASCDFVYSVRRSTPVDSRFDIPSAEQLLCRQPGYIAADSKQWDGESMAHAVQRGLGRAFVVLIDDELAVESFRIGPPTDDELDAWLQLQSEMVHLLIERFPFLPPESSWHVTNTYLEAQLGAGADERRSGARGSAP